jgi:hypothetical protein
VQLLESFDCPGVLERHTLVQGSFFHFVVFFGLPCRVLLCVELVRTRLVSTRVEVGVG